MVKKILKSFDYGILIIVFLLFLIGVISLNSATQGAGGDPQEFSKQIMWFLIGLLCLFATVFIDYKSTKKISIPFYVIIILLLVFVLRSNPVNGATSWFKVGPISFQPSEFAKIAIIITLSAAIEHICENSNINKIYNLLICGFIVSIPIFLLIKQPDYGTALVFIMIFAFMVFAGGLDWKYIAFALVLAIVAVPIAYNFILPEHAKTRIDVFLNPNIDPRGAGYNIIQSELAVGSGMLFGMGLYNGNQTQMGLLPMKTTDFIFPVISEEMGFVISCSVIVLYMILLVRIINVARISKDIFGRLLCIGVFAMLFTHFVENIGMCMGLLPITGIPLPFVSYGGSSMITNMIAVGLVESVAARKKKHLL